MHHVVAIPLDKRLAEFIGKGGAEGSINFYNRKMDDNVIVGLAPSSIEDKFYAVAQTLLVSQQVLLSTSNIDRLFGEILVACSLLDRHVILTDENSIDNLLAGIKIKDFEVLPKEQIIERILAHKPAPKSQGVRVDIDHAFPVKGIGCVALGIVTSGTVKVHDELYHSSGKVVHVKSIQSQDVDVQQADVGTRVGLALKNIEHDQIEKGDLLTREKVAKTDTVKCVLFISPVSKESPAVGSRYFLDSNFSRASAVVEQISGNEAVLKLDKQISIVKGDELLLTRESAPRIFASGKVL